MKAQSNEKIHIYLEGSKNLKIIWNTNKILNLKEDQWKVGESLASRGNFKEEDKWYQKQEENITVDSLEI